MERLTHLSLFSGIGGLDLAAEWAGFETVGQCEYAPYPVKVLEKHWPDIERWKDIHELSADEFYRRTGIEGGQLTCISGGFPCQPHSVAGLRKASGDERDLWPEYRRVISEIRPKWVVAENVRGLLSSEDGRFFRGILRDFADMGYDVGWCCYRAADVGAIHSRARIGIIAHANMLRRMETKFEIDRMERNKQAQHEYTSSTPSNTDSKRLERGNKEALYRFKRQSLCKTNGEVEEWTRRSNLFEPKLLRSYHGIPGAVDRIKALGNSVVPQQFYPIFKSIADIENMILRNNSDFLRRD
jgi:DNA (cytosine-5)-methyltransferase 1